MGTLFRFLTLFFVSMSLSACLLTRSQVKEQEKNSMLQSKVAESEAKYADVDESMRALRGRLEVLENEKNLRQQDRQRLEESRAIEQKRVDERFRLFKEALASMEKQIQDLGKKIDDLKKKEIAAAKKPKGKKKGIFERADDQFGKKNWKEAIVEYQNYREKYPKGRRYRQATYKIGVSFQELGLKDEARAFYKEVVDKFPKTKTAGQAKSRLKKLK